MSTYVYVESIPRGLDIKNVVGSSINYKNIT